MANKYPGGYQIIDLGDLSALDENGIKVPGLFNLINSATKPVIPTARLAKGFIVQPRDMAKMIYCSVMLKTIGDNQVSGTGWVSQVSNLDKESITPVSYIFVTKDDVVYIGEI